MLFIGLWNFADREGRFQWRPKKIKIEIFPCDQVDIDDLLDQLLSKDLIKKYRAKTHLGAGNNVPRYGFIPTFLKHQKPHNKEKPSEIPPYSEDLDEKTYLGAGEPGKGKGKHALNPDILNPESLKNKKPTSGRPLHFSKAYQKEISEKIDKAAFKLKSSFPEVYKFVQFNCKAKVHPDALLYVLEEMVKQNGIENHWAYGIKLIKKHDWNFKDRDRIEKADLEKTDFNAFCNAIEIALRGGKNEHET